MSARQQATRLMAMLLSSASTFEPISLAPMTTTCVYPDRESPATQYLCTYTIGRVIPWFDRRERRSAFRVQCPSLPRSSIWDVKDSGGVDGGQWRANSQTSPSHLGDESELVGLRLFRAFIDHESEGLTPPFLRWRAAPSGLEGDLLIWLGRSNGPRRLSDLIMQRGDQR